MGIFSESVDVSCTSDGMPESLVWAGRQYVVCAEPVRWFERRQWWAEEQRAPLGSGAGLVDSEIWRLQVSGADDPERSLTLDLSRHLGSGRWRLLRIHDAVPSVRKPASA